jgi:hypothetical protein
LPDLGVEQPKMICPIINGFIGFGYIGTDIPKTDISIFIAIKMDISVWTYR